MLAPAFTESAEELKTEIEVVDLTKDFFNDVKNSNMMVSKAAEVAVRVESLMNEMALAKELRWSRGS